MSNEVELDMRRVSLGRRSATALSHAAASRRRAKETRAATERLNVQASNCLASCATVSERSSGASSNNNRAGRAGGMGGCVEKKAQSLEALRQFMRAEEKKLERENAALVKQAEELACTARALDSQQAAALARACRLELRSAERLAETYAYKAASAEREHLMRERQIRDPSGEAHGSGRGNNPTLTGAHATERLEQAAHEARMALEEARADVANVRASQQKILKKIAKAKSANDALVTLTQSEDDAEAAARMKLADLKSRR